MSKRNNKHNKIKVNKRRENPPEVGDEPSSDRFHPIGSNETMQIDDLTFRPIDEYAGLLEYGNEKYSMLENEIRLLKDVAKLGQPNSIKKFAYSYNNSAEDPIKFLNEIQKSEVLNQDVYSLIKEDVINLQKCYQAIDELKKYNFEEIEKFHKTKLSLKNGVDDKADLEALQKDSKKEQEAFIKIVDAEISKFESKISKDFSEKIDNALKQRESGLFKSKQKPIVISEKDRKLSQELERPSGVAPTPYKSQSPKRTERQTTRAPLPPKRGDCPTEAPSDPKGRDGRPTYAAPPPPKNAQTGDWSIKYTEPFLKVEKPNDSLFAKIKKIARKLMGSVSSKDMKSIDESKKGLGEIPGFALPHEMPRSHVEALKDERSKDSTKGLSK